MFINAINGDDRNSGGIKTVKLSCFVGVARHVFWAVWRKSLRGSERPVLIVKLRISLFYGNVRRDI
jgi:hypothetical protein